MKFCRKCGEWKLPSFFSKDKYKKDGLRTVCKTCTVAAQRAYDVGNRDKINATRRNRYQQIKEKVLKYNAEWARNRLEYTKNRQKVWYENNKERLSEKAKEYWKANKEARIAYKKRYYEQKKEIHILASARRRAAKQQRYPLWDREFTELVHAEAKELAKRRKQLTGFNWHVDHIIPLRGKLVSGFHVWNNLQVIPEVMNRAKLNKFAIT
jgi:hypothetical protein